MAPTDQQLDALRAWSQDQLPQFIDDLRTLVNTDCGSYTKAGVDKVGRWTGAALERIGAEVEYRPSAELGDTVVARFEGAPRGPRVLLIGHLDTVFEPGTAAERPFRIEGNRAYGPGVTDMKSGLLAGIYAIEAIRALPSVGQPAGAPWPFHSVVFVANPDEEIGSPVSSPIIREVAAESDLCLVLECARANGDIVSSRKGIVDLRLRLQGRAAHAGVEPEKGRSAILEAAYKTIALHRLNDAGSGVSCTVGVLRGGSRPNVVPEEAMLEVDLRATSRADLEAAEARLHAIADRSTVPDVTTVVEVMGRHWPMEKLEASERLLSHARRVAKRLGFPLRDAATGGASDANTTAGMGLPTLDGLGPIGGSDHSPAEYLELDSIVPRVTLLAGLLLAIGADPESSLKK